MKGDRLKGLHTFATTAGTRCGTFAAGATTCCVLPIHVVVQRAGEDGAPKMMRPVFDATRAGVNGLLVDPPLSLPTTREIMRDLRPGDFIAKADSLLFQELHIPVARVPRPIER